MNSDLNAVRPEGILVQHGPAEREPSYDEDFVLPSHYEKPLQTLHSHPNDARLEFFEAPHVYTFDGVPTTTSVTSLAHSYEEAFDADNAIAAMKSSRSQAWPRLEYTHERLDEWNHTRGALATCMGKTVAVIPPLAMQRTSTWNDVTQVLSDEARRRDAACDDTDIEFFVFDRALTNDEIKTRWSANGMRASHMGTDRHLLAELFFNGLVFRWWEPDMQVLYEFCRTELLPRGIVAYNTEKEIVCRDADVAGSIDLILWDSRRGVHHIVDFKRSDKLQSQLWGFKKMQSPFNHLDDCKGAGYALQLSIYEYILTRDYGLTIGERILLSLHADRPFCTGVPYLAAETEYIMQSRMALVRARRRVADANPHLRCQLSEAPLCAAVRLDDGRRVMENVARVHDLPFSIDWTTRTTFDAAVNETVEPVELDRTRCVSWRRQMPTSGRPPFDA